MKKNTSWKFTDESSVTFQLSVSGADEFGHNLHNRQSHSLLLTYLATLPNNLYYKLHPICNYIAMKYIMFVRVTHQYMCPLSNMKGYLLIMHVRSHSTMHILLTYLLSIMIESTFLLFALSGT